MDYVSCHVYQVLSQFITWDTSHHMNVYAWIGIVVLCSQTSRQHLCSKMVATRPKLLQLDLATHVRLKTSHNMGVDEMYEVYLEIYYVLSKYIYILYRTVHVHTCVVEGLLGVLAVHFD